MFVRLIQIIITVVNIVLTANEFLAKIGKLKQHTLILQSNTFFANNKRNSIIVSFSLTKNK